MNLYQVILEALCRNRDLDCFFMEVFNRIIAPILKAEGSYLVTLKGDGSNASVCFRAWVEPRGYPWPDDYVLGQEIDRLTSRLLTQKEMFLPLVTNSSEVIGDGMKTRWVGSDDYAYYLGIKLYGMRGEVIGGFSLQGNDPEFMDDKHRDFLLELARALSSAIYKELLIERNANQQAELIRLEASIARRDHLTKLPNRLLLEEFVNQNMKNYQRSKVKVPFALLSLDLDKFKSVNDTYGHQAGDVVLQGVAERLQKMLRGSDLISRTGGDEFTIVLCFENEQSLKEMRSNISKVAAKIRETISKPFLINEVAFCKIGVSIGVAIYEEGDTLDSLAQRADEEMYKRKRRRR